MNPPNSKGITAERLAQLDFHFRAANYLSGAQLYLADNPLNGLSRYQLAIDALRRARAPIFDIAPSLQIFEEALARHRHYIVAHGDDMPEVVQWHFEPSP